jgi:transposase-like protein
LQGEINHHLTQEASGNRRNGVSKKQFKTGTGCFELETPRDRLGTFEPELVKKRQTVLNESLDQKVLSLYGLGMSYEAIRNHLQELYGLNVSSGKISEVDRSAITAYCRMAISALRSGLSCGIFRCDVL